MIGTFLHTRRQARNQHSSYVDSVILEAYKEKAIKCQGQCMSNNISDIVHRKTIEGEGQMVDRQAPLHPYKLTNLFKQSYTLLDQSSTP